MRGRLSLARSATEPSRTFSVGTGIRGHIESSSSEFCEMFILPTCTLEPLQNRERRRVVEDLGKSKTDCATRSELLDTALFGEA
eukprot:IDg7549t1